MSTTESFRIQYVSDIHLEHYNDIETAGDLNPWRWLEPDPTADALFLAGDIGWPERPEYKYFIGWCSRNWPKVFVVAGNHEYYNEMSSQIPLTAFEKINRIKDVTSKYSNVHFLDRDAVEVQPGLWILGCTLWSEVPPEKLFKASRWINDYKLIYKVDPANGKPSRITPQDTNTWHYRDVLWLQETLENLYESGQKAIVLTHHLPTEKLVHADYKGNPMNCCFASDQEDLIELMEPLAWICGHSHQVGTATVGDCKLALNPRGYPEEKVYIRESKAVLDIPL